VADAVTWPRSGLGVAHNRRKGSEKRTNGRSDVRKGGCETGGSSGDGSSERFEGGSVQNQLRKRID
jgi:hypothetical protein